MEGQGKEKGQEEEYDDKERRKKKKEVEEGEKCFLLTFVCFCLNSA